MWSSQGGNVGRVMRRVNGCWVGRNSNHSQNVPPRRDLRGNIVENFHPMLKKINPRKGKPKRKYVENFIIKCNWDPNLVN